MQVTTCFDGYFHVFSFALFDMQVLVDVTKENKNLDIKQVIIFIYYHCIYQSTLLWVYLAWILIILSE